MDILIIDTIRKISEKKRRPSVEAIYETLTSAYADIDDAEFCEVFKLLENTMIIKNIKPKDDMGSYRLNEETFINIYTSQNEYKLIQSQLIEVINVLRDQVLSLKHEMTEQNYIIQNLTMSTGEKLIRDTENNCVLDKNHIAVNEQDPLEHQQQKEERTSPEINSTNKDIEKSLKEQLTKVRHDKHKTYLIVKEKQKEPCNSKQINDDVHKWKPNTVLIAGDSTLNGIMEKRMGRNTKVRAFPGARIEDMFSYLIPLLKKNPKHVILHIGTNDAANSSTEEILNQMLRLKDYVEKALPESVVIISHPIIRTDDIKADNILTNLREHLEVLNINCIFNNNITKELLSKGGLHLNAKGCGRLAMNFISYIQHL